MYILITGASGFLGRFLTGQLKKQKNHIIELNSKNCDLTCQDSLTNLPRERFDYIYHLAAWTQAGDFCLKYPGDQWLMNQKINTNLLSWWKDHQPQAKLICIGTSCAYDPALPLKEENYLSGKPIDSLFTYAMTKRMLLSGLMSLHKQYALNYLYLIPSTLYGPNYHSDGRQMHFIFDLIRKILNGKFHGEPVILWGDGEQKRELVHVKDFVRIMVQFAHTETNRVINIGAGSEKTIKEFACLICKHIDYPMDQIVYDSSRYVGARSKCLDISLFKRIFHQFEPIPLEQGLQETIDWYSNNLVPALAH